ncbi:MAG: hypothetical protein AAGA48_26390 [Myxococcota bacterium]
MGLAIAARPRLLSIFIGMLASTWTLSAADALAKPKDFDPEDPVVCSEAFEDLRKQVRKRDAVMDEPAGVTLAFGVIPDATEASLLVTAKQACDEVAYVDKTFRVPAYLCLGEASARAANMGATPEDNYRDSYCAYQVAADLANKVEPADTSVQAEAQEGRAQALMALRRMDRDQAKIYADAAVSAYDKAIKLEPTAARHFALGRFFIELRNVKRAEKAIKAGADLDGRGTETARALVALAQLKRNTGATSSEVLAVLNRAKQAAPKSMSANGALGIAYFEADNLSEARQSFLAVIADGAVDDVGGAGRNYRADAHYYLALLDARTANRSADWQKVLNNAERAIQAGGGEFRYRRLVCLAYIGRGGKAIRDGAGGAWCEGQDSPEGQLLKGVYLLRRAQYVQLRLRTPPHPTEIQYRDYLTRAGQAFTAAKEGMGTREATVDWPGLPEAAEFSSTLAFGQDVVQWANTFCRSKLDKTDKAREVSVFDRYGALGCKP